jgi:mannose-6-phosphate isomerase
VFLVEVQEPTDFSILLEWSVTTSGREDSHLGLGFERAMAAVSHRALTPQDVAALCQHLDPRATGPAPRRALTSMADRFFRLDVIAPAAAESEPVPSGFAAVVALEGTGALVSEAGEVKVVGGDLLAVPDAFGEWCARGRLRLVVARPGLGWPATLSFGGER